MCWSFQVSIVFSIIDILAILFLIYRNHKNDRLYAVAFCPIALQEVGQVILWDNIGVDEINCNQVNKVTSLIVRCVIATIPMLSTLMATISKPRPVNKYIRKSAIPIAILSIVFFGYLCYCYISSQIRVPMGTWAGPNSHQVWPNYILFQEQPLLSTIGVSGYLIFSFIPWFVFLRPMVLAFGILVFLGVPFAVTRATLPVEWQSVWCWSGVFGLFWAVIQAYIPGIYPKEDIKGEKGEKDLEGTIVE